MKLLFSVLLCGVLVAGIHADAAAASEAQKIEYLIRSVEQMSNAKFIRNGDAYDAKAAADHLRLKLRTAGSHCKTAENFIRRCASKSSLSGEPYQIRFADGRVMTSEAFLRQKLKQFDRRKK